MNTTVSIALALAVCLPTALSAQTQAPTLGKLKNGTTPTPISYSLSEGVLQGHQQSARFGPDTIFDNTDGLSYYFATPPIGEEWVDECAFSADDLDGLEQIDGFTFEYCAFLSTTVDMNVRFYNDTVAGAGPTGWPTAQCAYGLAGLPGTTGGLPACWAVTIDLEGGFECTVPQETAPGGTTDFIGVSYETTSGDPSLILDSLLNAGGTPAVPGYGSQDYFEVFDVTGHTGTFGFGGGLRAQASFNLKLYGDGIVDTKVVNHDAPDVGDTLRLKSDVEFRSGSQVTYTLDNAAAGTFALVFATGLDATPGSITPGVTLLLDASTILTPPGPVLMSGGVNATYTTPVLPGLPSTVYAQAFELSGLPLVPGNVIAGSNVLKHDN